MSSVVTPPRKRVLPDSFDEPKRLRGDIYAYIPLLTARGTAPTRNRHYTEPPRHPDPGASPSTLYGDSWNMRWVYGEELWWLLTLRRGIPSDCLGMVAFYVLNACRDESPGCFPWVVHNYLQTGLSNHLLRDFMAQSFSLRPRFRGTDVVLIRDSLFAYNATAKTTVVESGLVCGKYPVRRALQLPVLTPSQIQHSVESPASLLDPSTPSKSLFTV